MSKMNRPASKTTMGYFREVIKRKPSLLDQKSNDELMDAWKRDHPGYTAKEVLKARQGLANLKSTMRREERHEQLAPGNSAPQSFETPASATSAEENPGLETLESQIDDCLMMAKSIDRNGRGLENVIRHLRLARNEVVLKLP